MFDWPYYQMKKGEVGIGRKIYNIYPPTMELAENRIGVY